MPHTLVCETDRIGARRLSGTALLITAAGLGLMGLLPTVAGLLGGTLLLAVGVAFTTPALQSGLTYYYDLKAEISRDGLTHTENKRVLVRSGDSIHMSFAQLEAQLKNSVITTTAGK